MKLAPAPHGEAVPQVREVTVDAFAGEGHVVESGLLKHGMTRDGGHVALTTGLGGDGPDVMGESAVSCLPPVFHILRLSCLITTRLRLTWLGQGLEVVR